MKLRRVSLFFAAFSLLFLTQPLHPQEVGKNEGRNEFLRRTFKETGAKAASFSVSVCDPENKDAKLGSGVLISKEGLVVTAESVVEERKLFTIKFSDGFTYKGKLSGIDRVGAIALLAISDFSPDRLSPRESGDSSSLAPGNWVICTSSDPVGFSVGIFSASKRNIKKLSAEDIKRLDMLGFLTDEFLGPRRTYRGIIQHDAPLGKELIGSPLIDREGKLIGVNVASIFRGVSLATPVERIMEVMPDLKLGAILEEKPYLGFTGKSVNDPEAQVREGVSVERVAANSPATAAGLAEGDIIVAVDDDNIASVSDLSELTGSLLPGIKVELKVLRKKGEVSEVELTVGRKPPEEISIIVRGTTDAQRVSDSLKGKTTLVTVKSANAVEGHTELTVESYLSPENLATVLENMEIPYLSNIHNVKDNRILTQETYIPKTLEECFEQLKKTLTKDQLDEFKNTSEDDIVKYHHGLGTWMRNNWGLWSPRSRLTRYFKEMGIFHADAISGIILTSFHRHLNNKDINLEGQVKRYQEYWKEREKENK